MGMVARMLMRQERIVSELSTYMKTSFEKIFSTLEELDPEVAEKLIE